MTYAPVVTPSWRKPEEAPSPPWSEHLSATVHKVVPNMSILNLETPDTSWHANALDTAAGRTVAVEGAPEEDDVTLARLTY